MEGNVATRQQKSKRARDYAKEALYAGLPRHFSHPTHCQTLKPRPIHPALIRKLTRRDA